MLVTPAAGYMETSHLAEPGWIHATGDEPSPPKSVGDTERVEFAMLTERRSGIPAYKERILIP